MFLQNFLIHSFIIDFFIKTFEFLCLGNFLVTRFFQFYLIFFSVFDHTTGSISSSRVASDLNIKGLGRRVGEEPQLDEVVKIFDWESKLIVVGEIRLLPFLGTDQAQIGSEDIKADN